MASFDTESLFTNIPLEETIDLCVENLFKDRTRVDNLLKYFFREFLTRTMPEALILFDQEFCKQHNGVPMGSPLGPTFINVCFVIMKKFGFKTVLLNLNLLSIEATLMIHFYFFP